MHEVPRLDPKALGQPTRQGWAPTSRCDVFDGPSKDSLRVLITGINLRVTEALPSLRITSHHVSRPGEEQLREFLESKLSLGLPAAEALGRGPRRSETQAVVRSARFKTWSYSATRPRKGGSEFSWGRVLEQEDSKASKGRAYISMASKATLSSVCFFHFATVLDTL